MEPGKAARPAASIAAIRLARSSWKSRLAAVAVSKRSPAEMIEPSIARPRMRHSCSKI